MECSTHREERNACRLLVGKPERKRPIVIPRRRWEDNVKMDIIKDIVVWTKLIWLRIGTARGLL
jgi:hypothetical protein